MSEQSAYLRAGNPNDTGFSSRYKSIKGTSDVMEARETFSSLMKGISSDLQRGASLGIAFSNALQRILGTLGDEAIDSLAAGLFGSLSKGMSGGDGMEGGLGSILGSLLKGWMPGFASGCYTGAGGRFAPAGVVHAGEYVFDADATRRLCVGTLESIRSGRGFASGGYVGPIITPRVPMAFPAAAADPASIQVNHTVINQTDADVETRTTRGTDGRVNMGTVIREMDRAQAQRVGEGQSNLSRAAFAGARRG